MTGSFPATRLRRARKAPWMRDMVAEARLLPTDLVLPIFVKEGRAEEEGIKTMPGITRMTSDLAARKAKQAAELGIPAVALFPVVEQRLKTERGQEALKDGNLVCRAIAEIKDAAPGMGIICDVALDPYTTHGHDGVLKKNGDVDNDATVEILAEQAVVLARAGCDIVAPSDMMDGRVGGIRESLDNEGFQDTAILAYAAKYASAFYGPFRDAVGSATSLGGASKKTYQMDFRNAGEALREVELDIAEGADFVMVKPGLPYLDIIKTVREEFRVPVFAYQVSGEYAMLKAAAEMGAFDFSSALLESLTALKRAGASAIFTYAAVEAGELIRS